LIYPQSNDWYTLFPNPTPFFSAGALSISGDKDVYVGTNYGLLYSWDGGVNWTNNGGGNISAVIITNNKDLFCSQNGFPGIYYYKPSISDWVQVQGSNTINNILCFQQAISGEIYIGTRANGVYKSVDGGFSWLSVNTGLPQNLNVNTIFINSSGKVYVGSDKGLYYSNDNGNTWFETALVNKIQALVIDKNDFIYVVSDAGNYFKSTDKGQTWSTFNLWNSAVGNCILANGSDIYVGTNFKGVDYYLSVTSSWDEVNSGFFENYPVVTSLAMNSKGYLYALTNDNVYKSSSSIFNNYTINVYSYPPEAGNITGGGTYSWGQKLTFTATPNIGYEFLMWTENTPGNVGIGNNPYKINVTANRIFYANYKHKAVSVEGNESIPTKYLLYQNYPNPFNPTTTISYSIPKSGLITIKVYDVLGREIETLVNENKPIGNYSVQFNANKLISGVYFYRMESGSYIESKKFVIIK